MIELRIHQDGQVKSVNANRNDLLLKVLQDNGFEIYSPCGGKGICGKCKVWLRGTGSVTACSYPVSEPVDIILPDTREAQILSEQHFHTVPVPFDPGPSTNLSAIPHGVAIDLGTTSLVFHLVNLVTGSIMETRVVLNPQAQFGADVISRISYASTTKGGLARLQSLIIDAFNEQMHLLADSAGIPVEEIVKITVAGNTTMLHLLLAVDPRPIALAPFRPGFTDEQILPGKELTLHCHPEAQVKVLPSVAAYVGADIVAGMASIRHENERGKYLFMDIGTNGELALIRPEGVLCCSAAAGPAFEGARISCGMGGTEGAISEYDEHGYKVIGDTSPSGICGSGLIDLVAFLLDAGMVKEDGLLNHDFIVERADRTETGIPIMITQQDIREVQLAKAAIAGGIKILLKQAGLTFEELDGLYLAGGFGNYINPQTAARIGLLPTELKDKTIPLGNTSGTGALLALKSTLFDAVMTDLLARTTYLELSENDEFTLEFAMSMNF
jgi:uncharacterized 2Fe-2S/4Fe-4S cluster protein (DUF4445 family)